jgi:hypothetical protein
MNNIVIVINCTEDGDRHVSRLTKAEFLWKFKSDHWGKKPKFAPAGSVPDMSLFVGIIVIDGDIVVPRPVQVVTEYEL